MGVDLTVDDGPARLDAYVAQVLEIVPDVLPEHVRMLVEQNEPTYEGQVVERILHSLFELPNYPKADPQGKGKRKREDDDQGREAKSVKVDYASKNRQPPGPMYAIQALVRISIIQLKSSAVKRQPKGKMKPQEELEEEVAFIKNKFAADPSSAAAPEATSSAAAASVEVDPENGGIECGCCFSSYAFVRTATTFLACGADTRTGHDDPVPRRAPLLQGLHVLTGCKLLFPASELRRFLTPKLLALYERVKQRKEIEAAGLEGLEECPHCDYKVVIENEQEKLFRCQNEECMAVTCRQCKKPDHLPKSCKEVEDDKKLDGRHAIEEAMTKALMRNCPKCQKAFIKEHGCNKMICPNCRTMSCYVCRKVILGYEHFNNPPPYNGRKDPNKCELWDSVEKRHSDEVTAAAKKATEEYKRAHPEVTEEDLKVDLPPAPVAGPSNAPVPGMLPRAVPPPLPFVFFGNQPIDPGPAFFMPPPPPAPPHFGQAGVDVGGFVGLPHEIARQRLMEQERLLVETGRKQTPPTHPLNCQRCGAIRRPA
ncbi:hypothetical protein EVJ58_g7836 [Rhodofomes roseus]|uniref:RING-type domain-containing protein n=1 Tax=Rhodofomes roseus TaxID=34475 RepID=A0A4Y9Y0V3_9APHY|nr:hypothetical protein EVJ58_g7836 [Rhodofomes roseus]